jgi:16S rRNA (cytidine1402-2'-O)-methyltransferase
MLILLPNLLGEEASVELSLPAATGRIVCTLDGLIAENEKEGRRFVRRFRNLGEIPIRVLSEHTTAEEVEELVALLRKEKWGLISDAGLPCIADPGSQLVAKARAAGIEVEALSGPSSIFLALMLSGLPSQSFAFHGYLERKPEALLPQVQLLQKRAQMEKSTQLFIEAPYRTQKMLEFLVAHLSEKTLLAVACDLTLPTEVVIVKSVAAWRKIPFPQFDKRPAVFLFA